MTRIAILCPGRGSYTENAMRTLPAEHPWVRHAEEMRERRGLVSLLALDHAEKLRSAEHLRPANVSPLIYLISMLDADAARARGELVAVAGNSMGWYTALAVAGALSFEDGLRLVQEMSLLQEEVQGGGQLLYPLVDEEWREAPARRALVDDALASSNGHALPSIDLCGYAVLAGDDVGLRHLLERLPSVEIGRVRYPLRLMQHGPYHTPFVASVAARARERLSDLVFERPTATLIDGFGRRHSPWSADTDELRSYTLGAQVTEPYDLSASLRVLLREFAPDRIVLPGPGNTLGGVVGQALVRERWRGIDSRAAFSAAQASDSPPIESMRR
jgi:malonyl CoA-acyl carrier protein transacylase